MICSLHDHFRRFRNPPLDFPEKTLAWCCERLRFVEVLKRGDRQLAERLVHEHFDHAGRLLLESLPTHSQRGKEARVTMALGNRVYGSSSAYCFLDSVTIDHSSHQSSNRKFPST
jgi:hypothetical protein